MIRAIQPSDAAAVRAICLETCAVKLRPIVQVFFCDYYLECEPSHCLVAVDAQDTVIGYILCTVQLSAYQAWISQKAAAMGLPHEIADAITAPFMPYDAEYPAHLHIDLAASACGHGTGRKLINALMSLLRAEGIPGVLLSVATDNSRAIHFYDRCGFQPLNFNEQSILYGMKLHEA